MPNPKRKLSKTRRDKRRTHYKATAKQLAVCPTTGEHHLPHRAFWLEGKRRKSSAPLVKNPL